MVLNSAPMYRGREIIYLGGFAELKKSNYYLSLFLSVRMEILGSHLTDFRFNLIFSHFSKIYQENSYFI